MRLLKVYIILAIFPACYGNEDQLNDKWKQTDEVVKGFDFLYNNIAHTVQDASNKQKRAFSIMVAGVLQYFVTNGTSVSVNLKDPADVIAADARSEFDLYREVLDPAINLVKRACPPHATVTECSKALAAAEQKEIESCPEFTEHLKFLKASEELFTDKDYQAFAKELLNTSKKCKAETKALKFLNNFKNGKSDVTSKLLKWFQVFDRGNYPCFLPPLEKIDNEINTTDDKDKMGNKDKKDGDKNETIYHKYDKHKQFLSFIESQKKKQHKHHHDH